jgi:hypothetical protein
MNLKRNTQTIQRKTLKALQILERVAGIEPAPSAWKAEVLPLNYTRRGALLSRNPWFYAEVHQLVEGVGFEPTKA